MTIYSKKYDERMKMISTIEQKLLIFGRERKAITLCAVLLILANILCETMLGFVNTVDILDAVYGVGGTVLSYILLWLISQYGVKMD